MGVALRWFIGPLVLLAAIVLTGTLPADAQRRAGEVSERRLIEAVRQLQQDVSDLEHYVYNSPPPGTSGGVVGEENVPATALLNTRMDNQETALRSLTGQVEELSFRVNQLSQRLETVIADFDLRLRALEGTGGQRTYSSTLGPQTGPQEMTIETVPTDTGDVDVEFGAVPADPTGPQTLGVISVARLSGDENTDFDVGMQLLRRGDFQGAETTFQGIIENYPESERLGEVNFWLGEALYVQDRYADAATAYLASARDYGDGDKAPDSLLKLGMSLAALGQVEQACGAFDQVARSYPNASDRVTRNVAREQAANNCN